MDKCEDESQKGLFYQLSVAPQIAIEYQRTRHTDFYFEATISRDNETVSGFVTEVGKKNIFIPSVGAQDTNITRVLETEDQIDFIEGLLLIEEKVSPIHLMDSDYKWVHRIKLQLSKDEPPKPKVVALGDLFLKWTNEVARFPLLPQNAVKNICNFTIYGVDSTYVAAGQIGDEHIVL
jgi:hypothetical protein